MNEKRANDKLTTKIAAGYKVDSALNSTSELAIDASHMICIEKHNRYNKICMRDLLIIHTRNKIISSHKKKKKSIRTRLRNKITTTTHTHTSHGSRGRSKRALQIPNHDCFVRYVDQNINMVSSHPISAPNKPPDGPSWVYFIKRQVGLPAESLGRKATRSIRRAKPTGLHCRGEKVDTNHLGLCKQAWTSREACFRLEVVRVSVVARERH